MDLLPNLDGAIIPIEKLENYVLNSEHPTGMHKARVFREWLGIEQRHAGVLAELIRASLVKAPAARGVADQYGQRWVSRHEIAGLNSQSAIVTVAWILKKNAEASPVLISCYIETRSQEKLRELFSAE